MKWYIADNTVGIAIYSITKILSSCEVNLNDSFIKLHRRWYQNFIHIGI